MPKILLPSASFCAAYLDCRETMNMNMGTIQQPYSLQSTSFYIPKWWVDNTLHFTLLWQLKRVAVKTSSFSPNDLVQSYFIQAIFALKVKVGVRKTIPQEQSGSYTCQHFHVIPKSVSQKSPHGLCQKKKEKRKRKHLHQFRVQQLKRGKLSAFTNYRKVIEVR